MTMAREEEKQEKARELAIKYCKDIDNHGKEVYSIGCVIACCEMADWADQHPKEGLWDSEKVIMWLKNNASKYMMEGINYPHYAYNGLVDDLCKAMEDKNDCN